MTSSNLCPIKHAGRLGDGGNLRTQNQVNIRIEIGKKPFADHYNHYIVSATKNVFSEGVKNWGKDVPPHHSLVLKQIAVGLLVKRNVVAKAARDIFCS